MAHASCPRPVLFDDHQKKRAAERRTSIVAPAKRSQAALEKAARKTTDDGLTVHSFQALLAHLATLTRNHVVSEATGLEFDRTARPTPVQTKAFKLLQITL